jgi:predicted ATPase
MNRYFSGYYSNLVVMVYVITGGPGFGKSVLIEKLHELGFKVGGEVARQIIEDQLESGGALLPWLDAAGFEKRVMDARIAFLNSIEINDIAFSDRGLPDQAAFSSYKGKEISPELKLALKGNHYAEKVYITPPWRQIYQNDPIRTETFEEAQKIHRFIVETYLLYGYEVIDLPFVSPQKRIEFILKSL